MNPTLENAFNRWLAAVDATAAMAVFIELCEILQGLVPSFQCPFAENADPTVGEQWTYVSLWQAQNNSGVFGSGGG